MLLLENAEVHKEPFPYAVIHPAIDEYEELEKTYPDYKLITKRYTNVVQNRLYQYHAAHVLAEKKVHQYWLEFFEEQTSELFFHKMAEVLPIYDYYPHLKDKKIGLRYRDKSTIQMDCLFGVNTPVTKKSSCKGPHLDNPHELYACLTYFPIQGDDAGGDLTVYKYTTDKPTFHGQRFSDDVEPIDIVPYKPNTAVLFLNTFHSLHGVTPRKVTSLPRRYVNVECEVDHRLFKI